MKRFVMILWMMAVCLLVLGGCEIGDAPTAGSPPTTIPTTAAPTETQQDDHENQ